jgi:endonuclease YncB( thermonuclease family)
MPSGYENSSDYGGPPPGRWNYVFAVLLVVAAVVAVSGWLLAAPQTGMTGTPGKISDGDTFWLCDENRCEKFRLCGIDAPEDGQPGSDEATAALSELVKGKIVRCLPVGDGTVCDGRSKRHSHDRTVAQCFVGATDIAAELVRQGNACDWPKFSGGHYGMIPGACTR